MSGNDASHCPHFAVYFTAGTNRTSHLAFIEQLNTHALDYSIESLKTVDEYLVVIRENKDLLTQAQYGDVVVWGGCYVGETIRKNASVDYKWMTYDDFIKQDAGIQGLVRSGDFPRSLGSLYILVTGGAFTIPLSKVQKFIEEGPQNSVHFYANGWLKPQGVKQTSSSEPITAVPTLQPNAAMENVIAALRKKLSLKQMLMTRWTVGKVDAPDWLKPDDALAEIYDKQSLLLQQGKVVWASLVQANSALFSPGDGDHPALLVYSTDPHFDSRPHELRAIAKGIFKLKNGTHSDPEVQKYAKMVTDELDRGMGVKLPKLFTAQNVRCSAFMVFRSHIPNAVLAAAWFPILVHDSTQAVMIVPEKYWPEKLHEMWRARQLMSAD